MQVWVRGGGGGARGINDTSSPRKKLRKVVYKGNVMLAKLQGTWGLLFISINVGKRLFWGGQS